MRTSHGYARLVGFSDGVVAIAITLLILPLVEAASDYNGEVGSFVADHMVQLLVFLLSFAVIGNFWVVHHQMWERLTSYNGTLLWVNLLWLLSIVFLPFPTELLSSSTHSDRATYALYVGTMVVTTAASFIQQLVVVRHPELQAEEVRGTLGVVSAGVPLAIMVIALLIAVLFPDIGLWGLILLVLTGPITRALTRGKKTA